jgi:hypothetical protein
MWRAVLPGPRILLPGFREWGERRRGGRADCQHCELSLGLVVGSNELREVTGEKILLVGRSERGRPVGRPPAVGLALHPASSARPRAGQRSGRRGRFLLPGRAGGVHRFRDRIAVECRDCRGAGQHRRAGPGTARLPAYPAGPLRRPDRMARDGATERDPGSAVGRASLSGVASFPLESKTSIPGSSEPHPTANCATFVGVNCERS